MLLLSPILQCINHPQMQFPPPISTKGGEWIAAILPYLKGQLSKGS